jgi:hypothetical protein
MASSCEHSNVPSGSSSIHWWESAAMSIKVKLPLWLINYSLSHKDIWGNGGISLPFLTLALDGGEWSASCPSWFIPGERAHSTHCIGGQVGPKSRSGRYRQVKDLASCRNWTPVVQPLRNCFHFQKQAQLSLFFDTEGGNVIFLWNIGCIQQTTWHYQVYA